MTDARVNARGTRGWKSVLAGGVAAGLVLLGASTAAAQGDPSRLPFAVGEELNYTVKVSGVKGSGRATMRVDGPTDVRGTATWRLSFAVKTRVGFLKAENRSESWLDPVRMASLRFQKRERQPLSRHDENVMVYPERREFAVEGGVTGETPTASPLDELSFIYFLRTLPLETDSIYRFDRHFDPARNPVEVRVLKRETITVPAGTFPAVVVEMRVKDPRYGGKPGVLKLHLSDDHCRLPLRIESDVPVAGRAVMLLESRGTPPVLHLAAEKP